MRGCTLQVPISSRALSVVPSAVCVWKCISRGRAQCYLSPSLTDIAPRQHYYEHGNLLTATIRKSRGTPWLELTNPRGLYVPLNDAETDIPMFEALTSKDRNQPQAYAEREPCKVGNDWPLLVELETTYLLELEAWEDYGDRVAPHRRRTRSDRYSERALDISLPRVGKAHAAKRQTNLAVASAAKHALCYAGIASREAFAMVLDGLEGYTLAALVAEGFRPQHVFAPNIVPSVAWALRRQGAIAWAGRVEDFLSSPAVTPLQLLYLDHTGAFPPRAGQLISAFESGAIGAGTVVACTFSTREGPWDKNLPPGIAFPGWSNAHAAHGLVHVLLHSAAAQGLSIEGANITGLQDYKYSRLVGDAESQGNGNEPESAVVSSGVLVMQNSGMTGALNVTLRRSFLAYPEQMVFLIVRVC